MKVLSLILGALVAFPACATVKNAGGQALDCAKVAVAADLAQAVTGILLAGAPDYMTQLDALGIKAGMDAVKCAVMAAVAQFDASGALKASPSSPAQRGRAYLER
jgi:hypothetical protein